MRGYANRNVKEKILQKTLVREKREAGKEIPKYVPSIFIRARLGINFAIINCEDIINSRLETGRRERRRGRDNVAGVALKCAGNAREDVKEEGTVKRRRGARRRSRKRR